ncbi:MAG: thioredoxin family protein [Leptospirales bacterium]
MSLTPSTMIPLGSAMPEFSLPEPVTGNMVGSANIKPDHATLVMFICNHCPYVVHLADHISMLASDFSQRPLTVFGINSNNVETHPADSPENMIGEATHRGYIFPYLFDETQQVAQTFGAVCTPDFFLYDKNRKLIYRGQFDDSRPGNGKPVTGVDLREAINATLDDEPVSENQVPSIGCNIKWKAGNEPD